MSKRIGYGSTKKIKYVKEYMIQLINKTLTDICVD